MSRTERVATKVREAMEAGSPAWTDVSLAEATGIPRSTLRRRLDGFSPFTVDELDRIATAIGVSFADLLALDAA